MEHGSQIAEVGFHSSGSQADVLVEVFDPDSQIPAAEVLANDAIRQFGNGKSPRLWSGSDARPRLLFPTKIPSGHSDCIGLGGRIAAQLLSMGFESASLSFPQPASPEMAARVGFGAVLRAYAPPTYRTQNAPAVSLRRIGIVTSDPTAASSCYLPFAARAAGIILARDLVNEPPNHLTPSSFADRILELAALGLEITLLDPAELEDLGMGALLAVARGSKQPATVAIIRWNGGDKDEQPLAFVGKGVTFDSGGLNVKPSQFMWKMKNDMGGAAAVVGAMSAIARRKARKNVVGVVGLVENMPSGDAFRPSDVLRTYSGKTVEVIDTDNEGRLVLCDILSFAERELKARQIIDIATLTGGARFALGAAYAPLCANDDRLADLLLKVGKEEGEHLWRMPCGPEYDSMISSAIADLKNGRTDIAAHAIVAARFLSHFVERTPWAHIDMAAMCMVESPTDIAPEGPSGFGVALLDALTDICD